MAMRGVVLLVLDGWGWREEARDNAIAAARTPSMHALARDYPFTLLQASGEDVGLPPRLMGNSDVGHLTLGAGRILFQMLPRIDRAVADFTIQQNEALVTAFHAAEAKRSTLHLMGLVSDGGVHSMDTHLHALVRMAAERGWPAERVAVHAFLDGRDTPPQSAPVHLDRLAAVLAETGVGRVATVIGRYYAMDRDKRWERTRLAWDALVHGRGDPAADALDAVRRAHAAGETDEFVKPRIIGAGAPVRDGDAVVCFNYRADRARQLTRALAFDDFGPPDGFDRGGARPQLAALCTMALYDVAFSGRTLVAFPPEHPAGVLAEVVSSAGLRQLHTAETEKYAHVTYFLNGGIEAPFPREERVLVASPREVATYDLKPEMSAPAVCEEVVRAVAAGHDLVVANFANADMVGHTGSFEATVRAVETVDACVGRIHEACLAAGRTLVVTADHGNAELMRDPVTGAPHTAHTTSPVPLHVCAERLRGARARSGGGLGLRDIAPTVLELMGLAPAAGMTGRTLLQ
ncbi:MAG TPA: 2,3-bisphosphoglycerate-independent phosphoglycerate mutase [Myxococcota bacterium]|jgi:2,3-bisphosphoglycerate-independent phosphoglycerate mutase|nr:2,3-bisphosphoglycerate-independent phosphoglycerate mutase [Myxococcota bacterium]